MDVSFYWEGNETAESGYATYMTNKNTVELRLPDFKTAKELHEMLLAVFNEGRSSGQMELIMRMTNLLDEIHKGIK